MPLMDSTNRFGLVSIGLHWVMALLVIGLFGLGIYMVELDYYHRWYHKAPDLHRSLGVITGLLLLLRIAWRLMNTRPERLGAPLERRLGAIVHVLFYVLLAFIIVSGYLISSAEGQAVDVFGWFGIPATVTTIAQQADRAGLLHEITAWVIILLTVLHSAAALKHHFKDRDNTLVRMFGITRD